jgi:hypothetical protein
MKTPKIMLIAYPPLLNKNMRQFFRNKNLILLILEIFEQQEERETKFQIDRSLYFISQLGLKITNKKNIYN